MANSIRASQQGLKLVDQARQRLGWQRTSTAWCEMANISRSTLHRFWQRQSLQQECFAAICSTVEIDWNLVAEADRGNSGHCGLDSPRFKSIVAALGNDEVRWVGRDMVVTKLVQHLQRDCRLLFIVGMTGIGKTSLATRLITDEVLMQQFPEQQAIVLDHTTANFDALARKLLDDRLLQAETSQQQPEQIMARLVQHLAEQPTLVVLDMVEEVLQSDGQGGHQFTDPQLVSLLVKILKADDMPSRIILTSQEHPPSLAEGRYGGRSHLEKLSGLMEEEALQLFEQWGIVANSDEEQAMVQRIIQVYEGHPLALRVIAGEMVADYGGSILDYWQDYRQELDESQSIPLLDCYSIPLAEKVKTRIERTFDRLRHTEPLACRLLCMASKIRIPMEREAWLFLLCDSPHEEASWAFQTLQRRFLLEVQPTKKQRLYRLHSLICRIAYAHLQHVSPKD